MKHLLLVIRIMQRSLVLLFIVFHAQSQVIFGWDANCDYDMNPNANALQLAINDGNPIFHITNQNHYSDNNLYFFFRHLVVQRSL